jgi:hypothetical protein
VGVGQDAVGQVAVSQVAVGLMAVGQVTRIPSVEYKYLGINSSLLVCFKNSLVVFSKIFLIEIKNSSFCS